MLIYCKYCKLLYFPIKLGKIWQSDVWLSTFCLPGSVLGAAATEINREESLTQDLTEQQSKEAPVLWGQGRRDNPIPERQERGQDSFPHLLHPAITTRRQLVTFPSIVLCIWSLPWIQKWCWVQIYIAKTYYGPGAVNLSLVFLTTTHRKGYCYSPIIQMRKLRLQE